MQENREIQGLLKKRPGLWNRMNLPVWGYNGHIDIEIGRKCKEMREAMVDNFPVIKACLLTVCYRDRKYIDVVLDSDLIDKIKDDNQRLQAYSDIGNALYDVGCRDGIKYIEKAIELESRKNNKYLMLWEFTLKLNGKINAEKKIALAKELILDTDKDCEKRNSKIVLAKAYIDAGNLDKAERIIKELMKEENDEVCKFLLAEFYLAKNNFKVAANAFENYKLPEFLYFWHAQNDYKKALAYYYAGEVEKCRKQALKIGRRKRWDRFYRLEDIEDNGTKREPFIDEIIDSNIRDYCIVDWERINHYRKMLWVIFKAWVRWHSYLIFAILVLILTLLYYWWLHVKTTPPVRMPKWII